MRTSLLTVAGVLTLAAVAPAASHDIVRRVAPEFPVASSVRVPAGAELVFVSGMVADAADPSAPPGTPERFGDTAAQARSVLGKIRDELRASGLSMSDIVKMTVYVAGDPARGGAVDFMGLMSAYVEYFGTDGAALPAARTTVQVPALRLPGALVEIEVIAARQPEHDH